MICVRNKRCSIEKIRTELPSAVILDVTSTSPSRSARLLSPFFPHGGIPIPFTEGLTATCVEAVWQGLKVFEGSDVDFNTFRNDTMKNLKRSTRRFGKPKGHRKGAYGSELLGYYEARMLIYLPTYKWVLDNIPSVHRVVERIREESKVRDIVLLDYNTNTDYTDVSKPLSHAGLLKSYIENSYPEYSQQNLVVTGRESVRNAIPQETITQKKKKKISEPEPSLFDDEIKKE